MSESTLKPPAREGTTTVTFDPATNVTFDAAERGEIGPYLSHCSTLNNSPTTTPQRSRDPSMERKQGIKSIWSGSSQKSSEKESPRYLDQNLDARWMGGVIITCFFTSGLIDAVAFNSWNCFVGMQTGNTVFAALGIGGQPTASHKQQYYKSLLAIGSFCLGTLFFNFVHRWHEGLAQQSSLRRRWVFASSFFIQTLCIITAAVLVTVGVVSNQPFVAGSFSSGSHIYAYVDGAPRYADLVPIAILSFEAAGQVCLSRVLAVIELPTIVLSTLYHDFTADLYGTRQLWKQSSSLHDFVFVQFRRQAKRLMSIMALFCGALVGGEMYKSHMGMAGALWLAAGLKLVISVTFIFWRPDKATNTILPK